MASPSVTYTFTNGTTADATQVNQNFSDILNGISDGTKDLSINALTLAGTLNANGNINLGNASGDDLSIAASLASNLVPKTDATYTLGSSTIGFLGLYLGRNSRRVRLLASAALAASYDLTLPTSAGTDKYFLKTNGSGATSWGQLDDPAMMTTGAEVAQTTPGIVKQAGQLKATNTNDTAGLGYVGELLSRTKTRSSPQSLTSGNASNVTASAFALDPGDWLITGFIGFTPAATTNVTVFAGGISATSGTLPSTDTLAVPTSGEVRVQHRQAASVPAGDVTIQIPSYRVTVAAATSLTLYLVALCTFSVSTVDCYGHIQAWRVR